MTPGEMRAEGEGPRQRWRPHPFELVAVGAAVSAGVFLTAQGLPLGARSLRRTVALALTLLLGGGLVGVVLQCGWHLLARRGLGDYLRRLREPAWLALWVRLWLACMLASYAYFQVKVYVPVVNPARWDEALWRLDRLLHLGLSPTATSLSWLPAGTLTAFLDVWYGLWLLSLGAGIAFFAASEHAPVRRGAVLSCIVLWVFGAITYTAVPVVGPVFAFPGFFSGLVAAMPIAATTQANLWSHHAAVSGGAPVADYTRGLAALPSLHVGFHFLFALWARHAAPRLFPFLLAMTLVTFVGSVRTGWHYAIDGYAGALLAALAYWIGRRLEGAEES